MFFDDERLKQLVKVRVNVKGKFYRTKIDDTDFKVGDVVLDKKDGCHAVIDYIADGHAALIDECVVEVYVPLTRLIKLELLDQERN